MQRSFGAADDVSGIDEEEEEEENDDDEESSSEDELTEEQVEQYKNLVLESRFVQHVSSSASKISFLLTAELFASIFILYMYVHLCVVCVSLQGSLQARRAERGGQSRHRRAPPLRRGPESAALR